MTTSKPAGVFDGASLRFYTNGVLVGEMVGVRSAKVGARTLIMGSGLCPPGYGCYGGSFRGTMDEVRVWNTSRSPAQIRDTLNQRITGTEPGIIAYYRFDENAGNVAADATSNGHLAGLGGGVSANQPAWIDSTAPLFAPVQASNSAPNTILLTLSGSDPDGDSLRAIITRLPSHGTLYQTTDGITPGAAITSVPAVLSNASLQVLYIRTAGFVGTDQFSYRVTDGYLTSAEAVARFQVINTSTSPLSLISAVADE